MNVGLDSVECACGPGPITGEIPPPPNSALYQHHITPQAAFDLLRLAYIAGEATPLADYMGLEAVKPIRTAAVECAQRIFSGYCEKFVAVELVTNESTRTTLYPRSVYDILRTEDRPPIVDQYGVAAVSIRPNNGCLED